jgi:ATP-dependent RNA helicase DeaD
VKVQGTPPPPAEAIAAAARAHFADALVAEEPSADATGAADDLLARVEAKLPARDLLRRLLARELARLPVGEPVRPVQIAGPGPGHRAAGAAGHGPPARRRTHDEFAREGVAFRVNLGAKDRADPRWLLPLICRRGGVSRREVGAIRIGPHETVFEIAGDAAADFALAASEPDPRARHVVFQRAEASRGPAPPHARPPHARPPQHAAGNEPPRRRPHQPPHPRPQPPRKQGKHRGPLNRSGR